MTRSIHADLLTEQKKLAYVPSLAVTFSDNHLPHPVLVKTPLSNYSGNPTASVRTTNAIVRAHRVAGVGIQRQKITDPTNIAQWETWYTVGTNTTDAYPALFWTGAKVVLVYQDTTTREIRYRTSTDEGGSWSGYTTLWTPAYYLNNTQIGVSGGATRSGFAYANGTTLYFRLYNNTTDTFGAAVSKTYAGNVWASGGAWDSGDIFRFMVILEDYADWTDCAMLTQKLTYDGATATWAGAVQYIGIQGGEGASPAYKFDYAHLAKVGNWFWCTYAYTASADDGALYDNNDTMIAASDTGAYFSAGLRTGQTIADRLQVHEMGGVTYLCSDKHLLTSTPPTTISAATADVKALDIQDQGPTAYADLTLDNHSGAYDTLHTGRLGCDITIERGAICAGVARRVTRELFVASQFSRQETGKTVTIHAYNYYRLLSLWTAEIAYYYADIALGTLVKSIAALAGLQSATTDAASIWTITVGEFSIQPGQSAADAISSLQDQFQFVTRMGADYTLECLVLSASPAADYVLGTGSGQHKTLILEDTANRSAPNITHTEVIGDNAGAMAMATAIQSEMGRQFTHRITRQHLTTNTNCATIAAAITTKINAATLRADLVGLPAFHLQPFDAVQSSDWTDDVVRYVTGLRETYNPTSIATLPRRVKQVWRQTLTLASLVPTAAGAKGINTIVPQGLKRSDFVKGKVISFDSATWKALVRISDQAGALRIRAGHWISPDTMTAGKQVAIILFDTTNPEDGLIVGPYGGAATWQQFAHMYAPDGSPEALTIHDSGALITAGDVIVKGFIRADIGGTLTLAGGVVTATASYHYIDTEGGAASDDCDTINGGTTGCILILRTYSSARDVTLKDGTGNLHLVGDFVMATADYFIVLFRTNSATWVELSRTTP